MVTITPKLPGENNKDYSYRIIKEGIMSLELEPGQLIREIEFAEALHLSRTPIREVMGKLREENLIEVYPQVGTYISKIKPQLIKEASFMRLTLEREVLKHACESFPRENLLELKGNFTLQEKLIGQKGQERAFHRLDTQFHHIIFQGNNKENIWSAISRLSTHYNRMRLLSEIKNGFDSAIAEHQIIIQMIENKEIEKAEDIVRQHIIEPIKLWGNLYSDDIYTNYIDYA